MISHAWQCGPELADLFAPVHAAIGTYEVCTAPDSLDQRLADAQAQGYTLAGIEALEPFDAFGDAAAYDRFAVARLYRGARARVVHGWRRRGQAFESVTLISPYPDASQTHLMTGTMLIRWGTIIRSSP